MDSVKKRLSISRRWRERNWCLVGSLLLGSYMLVVIALRLTRGFEYFKRIDGGI
jgi:hypothetical protein